MSTATWPKSIPALTPEQEAISNDFVRHWHEVLPARFGIVDRFNHGYPVRHAPRTFLRTLEIGAGTGTHLEYERLTPEQQNEYYALDLRENMAQRIRQRFPRVKTAVGDCQTRLDFAAGHFDRILAIHVLEHLPNLPAAVAEMRRLVHPQRGVFSVVIPCEGGLLYGLGRRLSAQRIFERRYGQSYRWFIQREHLSRPHEILQELQRHFRIVHRTWYPFRLPSVALNLCIGLTLVPKTA